jgi:hypothetical protein
VVSNGYDYRDMASYIKWIYDQDLVFGEQEFAGLYYAFQIQFPLTPEDPVILNIEYKQATGDLTLPVGVNLRIRFCIRIDGGPYDGYYLTYVGGLLAFRTEAWGLHANEVIIPIDEKTNPVSVINLSFNLTDDQMIKVSPINTQLTSLWELLGKPETQKFMIFFFPMEWWLHIDEGDTYMIPTTQFIGDIQVNLSNQKVLNKLTYFINADFEKTEELDIDYFDLDNINFVNGLMVMEGSTSDLGKTRSWISYLEENPVPLMDIFARNKFQMYARTTHRLKGKILYDGYLKPFTVITDDDLQVEGSDANLNFILHKYIWDLVKGTYDIDAPEYTDEEIVFDLSEDPGAGSVEESDGEYGILQAPTSVNPWQSAPGEGFNVGWDAVTGAGYIVQRKPYYDIYGEWTDAWKTVYQGIANWAYDAIQLEATPPNGMSVYYRVMATNNVLNSAYSDVAMAYWLQF